MEATKQIITRRNMLLEASARANEFFHKEDVSVAAKNIGIDASNYDMKEMIIGMNIEKEHGSMWGNDVNVTGDQAETTLKIVIAHLREHPNYYTGILIPALKNTNESFIDGRGIFRIRGINEEVEDGKMINTLKSSPGVIRIAAGILPICRKTGRILLGRRGNQSSEAGKWAGFGGKLERDAGETQERVLDIAKREFTEETGYRGFYNTIPSYIYTNAPKTFTYYNLVGLFDDEFEPALNSEHSECKWFSLDDLYNVPTQELHYGLKMLFSNDPSCGNAIGQYAK